MCKPASLNCLIHIRLAPFCLKERNAFTALNLLWSMFDGTANQKKTEMSLDRYLFPCPSVSASPCLSVCLSMCLGFVRKKNETKQWKKWAFLICSSSKSFPVSACTWPFELQCVGPTCFSTVLRRHLMVKVRRCVRSYQLNRRRSWRQHSDVCPLNVLSWCWPRSSNVLCYNSFPKARMKTMPTPETTGKWFMVFIAPPQAASVCFPISVYQPLFLSWVSFSFSLFVVLCCALHGCGLCLSASFCLSAAFYSGLCSVLLLFYFIFEGRGATYAYCMWQATSCWAYFTLFFVSILLR